MTVSIRQNKEGNWWASATYNGSDISEEGLFINQAKERIEANLKKRGCTDNIEFGEPQPYKHRPQITKAKISFGYAKSRIDTNPIA